jgi:hypothetical protein
MTEEVRLAKYEAAEVTRPYAESEASSSVDDKSSLVSLTPSIQSATPEGPLSRVGTPKVGSFEEVAESVIHAIILPSYKEDLETMKETISVLASHVLAKSSYDVSEQLEFQKHQLMCPSFILQWNNEILMPKPLQKS